MMLTAHVWQSTLCTAAAAAIVVLILRRAPARYRHAMWMLAAAKFLLPFAFLVATGAAFSAWLPAAVPLASWINRSLPFFTLRSGTSELWTASGRVDLIWPVLMVRPGRSSDRDRQEMGVRAWQERRQGGRRPGRDRDVLQTEIDASCDN